MAIAETAMEFFDACETGAGWEVCRRWCHDGATFSAQAEVLADMTRLADYVDWMKGVLTEMPDGHYELKAFSVDEARNAVSAFGVFRGTAGGRDGEPTRQVATDYVYVMEFDGERIRHMTKIWNDGFASRRT